MCVCVCVGDGWINYQFCLLVSSYRECFIPMTEMSGNVKQFAAYINQVFPAGALYLAATDAELKRLLMELTTELLKDVHSRRVCSARIIGRNQHDGDSSAIDANAWVFSPTVTVSSTSVLLQPENSPVLWLERPTSSSNSANSAK